MLNLPSCAVLNPPLLPPYIAETNNIASLILGTDRVLMELQLTSRRCNLIILEHHLTIS